MNQPPSSQSGAWRLFIALWPDDEALDALAPIDRWIRRHDSHRLTRRDQRHLTLAFLGDVEPAITPEIVESVRDLARRRQPFEAPMTELLLLPNARSPRVVALGVAGAGVTPLRRCVLEAVSNIVLTEPMIRDLEREPKPHLTIARARRPQRARRLDLSRTPTIEGRLKVDAIRIVRSVLTPNGPVYNSIEQIPLGLG